ncbi:hypothetical protein RJ640_004868 [Escallonia rubra]|uniref:RIN4 pathogenic type III effector avirulence factor Avr cleavage site domain-containing protein n=1 Tax=Escallonia rubra TaxID=112253 RepID=A0AA88QFE2_9ASTE|nr:hypothetical protein RJ640_004868 [Escallonia rubra]
MLLSDDVAFLVCAYYADTAICWDNIEWPKTHAHLWCILPDVELLSLCYGMAIVLLIEGERALCIKQEKGQPLPKFGEWDVNDPASADGFTVIFNKARDERKTGGKPESPGKADYKHGVDAVKPQAVSCSLNPYLTHYEAADFNGSCYKVCVFALRNGFAASKPLMQNLEKELQHKSISL